MKSLHNDAIVTMFIARVGQLIKLYGSADKIPIKILNVAKRNEKQKLMEKSETYKAK